MSRKNTSLAALMLAFAAASLVACSEQPSEPATDAETAVATTSEQTLSTSPEDSVEIIEDWGVFRAGSRDVPARTEGTIRLASYNVLNLFDDVDDPTEEGFVDDFHNSRNNLRGKPEPQLQAVADAIRAIDADIIGLQEIESLKALTNFRDNYLSDMGYDYIVSLDMGHARGIEQSIISRFPVVGEQVWPNMALEGMHPANLEGRDADLAGTPMLFRRGPLKATVQVPGEGGQTYDLTLFVVHHKSGRSFQYWRDAEANAVINLVNQELAANPDANIAVLGDFNATPGSSSLNLYTEEAGMVDVKKADDLVGTASITHASNRTIDFILINQNMNKERVEGTAFVYATHLRPRDMNWRDTPTPPGYAADHMPLTVDVFIGDR